MVPCSGWLGSSSGGRWTGGGSRGARLCSALVAVGVLDAALVWLGDDGREGPLGQNRELSLISPGGIPRITTDCDAVAGHGLTLRNTGRDFATTGADVHSTWQGLAGCYSAPEADVLLAATVPVKTTAADVGADITAVGDALVAFADEVRPLQTRLDRLRADAAAFVDSVRDDDDWRSDAGKVDHHNGLLAGVEFVVAAWAEAQRRCANAINARVGGTQYVADNGDGRLEANEYGSTAEQLAAARGAGADLPWGRAVERDKPWWQDVGSFVADAGHTVLDVAGLVPVIGEAADGLNAAWYTAEGDYLNASLSAAAMIPVVGSVATGARLGRRAADAVGAADDVAAVAKGGDVPQFWNRTTDFRGNKVYQRNDLVDPELKVNGETNLQRMRSGRAPIGPDGNPLELHHMLQRQDGPIAELTRTFHADYRSIIHINPNTIPSGINRSQFNTWRRAYWRQRARDLDVRGPYE